MRFGILFFFWYEEWVLMKFFKFCLLDFLYRGVFLIYISMWMWGDFFCWNLILWKWFIIFFNGKFDDFKILLMKICILWLKNCVYVIGLFCISLYFFFYVKLVIFLLVYLICLICCLRILRRDGYLVLVVDRE